MPASFLHQSVARATLGSSPAGLAGAEGPDPLFFCLHRQRGVCSPFALGSRMHRERTGAFLLALLRGARTSVQRDYALGFLTHYATDTTFHPFVYARTRTPQGRPSGTLHCAYEHALDQWLYLEQGHRAGTPRHMAGIAALTRPQRAEVAQLLCQAVRETYPDQKSAGERLFEHALDDSVRLARILYSPTGIKYALLGALAWPLGLQRALHAHMVPARLPKGDLTNETHAPWESPFAPGERHESVPDLLQAARARALTFVDAARAFYAGSLDEAALAQTLGSMSYDSGLPCAQDEPPKRF